MSVAVQSPRNIRLQGNGAILEVKPLRVSRMRVVDVRLVETAMSSMSFIAISWLFAGQNGIYLGTGV